MDSTAWNSAAYGRACAGCAQAKCKCLVPEDGGKCARCRRLNTDCRPATRVRKSNPTRVSKTAQLERKLDGLMSLLQGVQPEVAPASTSTSDRSSTSSAAAQVDTVRLGDQTRLVGNILSLGPVPPGDAHFGTGVLHSNDTEILRSFCAEKLPLLPVVHIPESTNIEDFKTSSPFLWSCITLLHYKDLEQQEVLNAQIKERAATLLLVEYQRSMDLLQGLLVYLGWLVFASPPQKTSFSPYMQMVKGLVVDMGLNRPTPRDPTTINPNAIKPGGYVNMKSWVALVRTMDERRAVLSSFVLTSSIAHFLGRTDHLPWTLHMRQCLDVLAESKETPNDAVLVQLVRSQLIIDRVAKGLGNWGENTVDGGEAPRAPPSFYTNALRSEWEAVRDGIPLELSANETVRHHLYHAEVTLHETALLKPTGMSDDVELTRLDNLFACLDAIKRFFQLIFTLIPQQVGHFPTPMLFSIVHCLVVLSRLSIFEYPGWDRQVVRRTVDVLATAQRLSEIFLQIPGAIGLHADTDRIEGCSYSKAARLMLDLRAGWEAKLADLTVRDSVGGLTPSYNTIGQDLFDTMWLSWPDFLWLGDSTMTGQ